MIWTKKTLPIDCTHTHKEVGIKGSFHSGDESDRDVWVLDHIIGCTSSECINMNNCPMRKEYWKQYTEYPMRLDEK